MITCISLSKPFSYGVQFKSSAVCAVPAGAGCGSSILPSCYGALCCGATASSTVLRCRPIAQLHHDTGVTAVGPARAAQVSKGRLPSVSTTWSTKQVMRAASAVLR